MRRRDVIIVFGAALAAAPFAARAQKPGSTSYTDVLQKAYETRLK